MWRLQTCGHACPAVGHARDSGSRAPPGTAPPPCHAASVSLPNNNQRLSGTASLPPAPVPPTVYETAELLSPALRMSCTGAPTVTVGLDALMGAPRVYTLLLAASPGVGELSVHRSCG